MTDDRAEAAADPAADPAADAVAGAPAATPRAAAGGEPPGATARRARRRASPAAALSRRVGGHLVLVLVVAAPLAIGTVHPWTRTAVYAGCALAAACVLWGRALSGRPLCFPLPAIALLAAALATAAQLVPLPAALLAEIAPAAHDTFTVTLGPAYGWHSLSLDPPGTWHELAKLGAYLAFLVAAVNFATRPARRRRLLLAVAAVATVAAIAGIAAYAAGTEKILFLYAPRTPLAERLVRGPFVNPNHLGGLLVVAAPVVLAMALREPSVRVLALVALIPLNLAAVMSISRGAVILVPLSQLAVAILGLLFGWGTPTRRAVGDRDDDEPGRRGPRGRGELVSARATAIVAAVAALAVAGSLVASQLDREYTTTRDVELTAPIDDARSKLAVAADGVKVALRHRWTGAGRGAFEQALGQVSERPAFVRHEWVENAYVQGAADWGLPVAAGLLVLGLLSLVAAGRLAATEPLGAGVLASVLFLAAHEAGDFAVEIAGVALPALAVLAALPWRDRAGRPNLSRRARLALGLLPAGVLALALARLAHPTAEADTARLRSLVRDDRVPAADVLAAGTAAARRHPADHLIHGLVAERLLREGDPAALRWLNRAIYLQPSNPVLHLMAGEALAAAGRKSQALLEYRASCELHPAPGEVWRRVARRYPALADLLAATPGTEPRLLQLGDWLAGAARGDDAEQVYRQALALAGPRGSVAATRRLLARVIARGDVAEAEALAAALRELDGRGVASRLLVVRSLILAGRRDEAGRDLDALRERTPETFALGLELAGAHSVAGEHEQARARLRTLEWAAERPARAQLHRARAAVEDRAGNAHQAAWERDQAAGLERRR